MEKKIDLTKVKGKNTRGLGLFTIGLALVVYFGITIYCFTLTNNLNSIEGIRREALKNLGNVIVLSGVISGAILQALGQIMMNTGTTALIYKTKAEEEGYKIE